MLNFLDTDLYERQGKAVNNFNKLLADPQSELAAQTLKDPYNFDFLTLDGEYRAMTRGQDNVINPMRYNITVSENDFSFQALQLTVCEKHITRHLIWGFAPDASYYILLNNLYSPTQV